jgi:pimeloyl-ACP methyl ester carboxylesterase
VHKRRALGENDSGFGRELMSESVVNAAGASLRYQSIGSGLVVVILHGAYSAHVELRAALEPIFITRHGYRRLYVDLPGMGESPAHESIASDPAHVDEYCGYFVSHTPASAQRFNAAVVPALGRFDAAAVARVMERWEIPADPVGAPFAGETLIMTGRHDSAVGFREQFRLVDSYPQATYVVASGAGHALPHERPDLVATVLGDWLRLLRTDAGTDT